MLSRIDAARVALEGLSVGDAFGEQLLHCGPVARQLALEHRAAPVGRKWMWTDDTAMAISIVEVLDACGEIDSDRLARLFAHRYYQDPARGYGGAAHQILSAIAAGDAYEIAAKRVFGGEGSCGNGGAMRSAPIGAHFADDLRAVVEQAA